MPERGHLRRAIAQRGFRRLYLVRMAGQLGDGVFQASLAAAVLFNPAHQARAAQVAAGLSVLLLPYSLVGPFAGVLLDRWWRQRVLMNANVIRAVGVIGVGIEVAAGVRGLPFYASALLVVSVNRFVLSGLSTALPHTVERAELVTANAFATTSGALATTAGGAIAIGLRIPFGDSDRGYGAIAIAALVPYLLAAFAASGFERTSLGPDDVERGSRETVGAVFRGLIAGARHVYAQKPAFYSLITIGVQRLCYGVSTVCTLLLYRNYFPDRHGVFRAGLTGLGQAVTMVAIGSGLAALLTPAAARRLGLVRWPSALLGIAAIVQIGFGLPYTIPALLAAAFGLGFVSQGIKICVDTLVQQSIEDDFRGRVFAFYDTLFNLTFVAAAVLTAILLPDTGHAPISVVAISLTYALIGLLYLRTDRSAELVAVPSQ